MTPRTIDHDTLPDLADVEAAAAHGTWFREQVTIGLAEADDPNAEWVTHEEAQAIMAKKRAEWAKLAARGAH